MTDIYLEHISSSGIYFLISFSILMTFFTLPVGAADIALENNGTDSENHVISYAKNVFLIIQQNMLDITNTVFQNSSTGNNAAVGNSTPAEILTGDIINQTELTVTANQNSAVIDCCRNVPQVPEFSAMGIAASMAVSLVSYIGLKIGNQNRT